MEREEKNLEDIVNEVLAEDTEAMLEIQEGISSSIDKLVVKVMKRAKVKTDPGKIRDIILSKL